MTEKMESVCIGFGLADALRKRLLMGDWWTSDW